MTKRDGQMADWDPSDPGSNPAFVMKITKCLNKFISKRNSESYTMALYSFQAPLLKNTLDLNRYGFQKLIFES